MPTQGGQPAGVPSAMPPQAPPPDPSGGTPNPPAGSKGPLLQMILAFLAGIGAKPASDLVRSILGGTGGGRGAKGGDPNRPHQGGVKVQADPSNPGGAGATPSAMNPQMIQTLLKLLASKGQGGTPQGPPQ